MIESAILVEILRDTGVTPRVEQGSFLRSLSADRLRHGVPRRVDLPETRVETLDVASTGSEVVAEGSVLTVARSGSSAVVPADSLALASGLTVSDLEKDRRETKLLDEGTKLGADLRDRRRGGDDRGRGDRDRSEEDQDDSEEETLSGIGHGHSFCRRQGRSRARWLWRGGALWLGTETLANRDPERHDLGG